MNLLTLGEKINMTNFERAVLDGIKKGRFISLEDLKAQLLKEGFNVYNLRNKSALEQLQQNNCFEVLDDGTLLFKSYLTQADINACKNTAKMIYNRQGESQSWHWLDNTYMADDKFAYKMVYTPTATKIYVYPLKGHRKDDPLTIWVFAKN
jgi:hypothetical protein